MIFYNIYPNLWVSNESILFIIGLWGSSVSSSYLSVCYREVNYILELLKTQERFLIVAWTDYIFSVKSYILVTLCSSFG